MPQIKRSCCKLQEFISRGEDKRKDLSVLFVEKIYTYHTSGKELGGN
jgi:hypothetical protein